MTFLFKIIIFFIISKQTYAKILITYQGDDKGAVDISKIIKTDYHIPQSLIELRYQKKPCHEIKTNVVAHLCLDSTGELYIINVNERMLHESYRQISKRTENAN